MGVVVGAAGPDGGSAAAAVVPVAAVRYGQCWSHGRGEGRSQILEYEMMLRAKLYIFLPKPQTPNPKPHFRDFNLNVNKYKTELKNELIDILFGVFRFFILSFELILGLSVLQLIEISHFAKIYPSKFIVALCISILIPSRAILIAQLH